MWITKFIYLIFEFDKNFPYFLRYSAIYYLPPATEGHGREIIKRLPYVHESMHESICPSVCDVFT